MKWFWEFILFLTGWRVLNAADLHRRCVVAVTPHTSYWDGVIGYVVMKYLGINFKVISAEWLFFFPFKYVMKYIMHGIPCGKKSGNSIRVATRLFKEEKDVNLIICPEGQLAATDQWNKGFSVIAKMVDVPIVAAIFDYNNKEITFFDMGKVDVYNNNHESVLKSLTSYTNILGSPRHPDKYLGHKSTSK